MISGATLDGIMLASLVYGGYSATANAARNLGLIKNFKINNINAKPLQSISKNISTSIEQKGSSNLMGSKRMQLQYAPFQKLSLNNPITIDGIKYSGHAIDKMQNIGIVPSIVDNVIKKGTSMVGKRVNTLRYFDADNNITVITNSLTKEIITVSHGKIK